MYKILLFIIIFTFTSLPQSSPDLNTLLKDLPQQFDSIVNNPEKYRLQIIYSSVNRNNSKPSLSTSYFNISPLNPVSPNHSYPYFYPASTVKLPAALLALEKLNNLHVPGLNKYTSLRIDSSYSGQSQVIYDSSSSSGAASIAHYIKKIFLVSDNDAFNRLYEFMGQEAFNKILWNKGYGTRISHRLSVSLTPEQNRHTNGFMFYSGDSIIYKQQPLVSDIDFSDINPSGQLQGEGYIQNDSLIRQPKDFSASNFISLPDLHNMIAAVLLPEALPENLRFNLTEDDYTFLRKYMSMLPRESEDPVYDLPGNYVKYFIVGDMKMDSTSVYDAVIQTDSSFISNPIEIYNKIGMAYGYLIDNAYILDKKNNIEFFLTAVIYVNEDGIFNDDKYEYDTIGIPFLSSLGRLIYNYHLSPSK